MDVEKQEAALRLRGLEVVAAEARAGLCVQSQEAVQLRLTRARGPPPELRSAIREGARARAPAAHLFTLSSRHAAWADMGHVIGSFSCLRGQGGERHHARRGEKTKR